MASLAPEDKVKFLLAVLKNIGDGKPDMNAIAVDTGAGNRANARFRFKQIVEKDTPYQLTGENHVILKEDAGNAKPNPSTPTANKKQAAKADTPTKDLASASTNAPADTTQAPATPKSNAADEDEQTPVEAATTATSPKTPTSATPNKRGRPKKTPVAGDEDAPKTPAKKRKTKKEKDAEAKAAMDAENAANEERNNEEDEQEMVSEDVKAKNDI